MLGLDHEAPVASLGLALSGGGINSADDNAFLKRFNETHPKECASPIAICEDTLGKHEILLPMFAIGVFWDQRYISIQISLAPWSLRSKLYTLYFAYHMTVKNDDLMSCISLSF